MIRIKHKSIVVSKMQENSEIKICLCELQLLELIQRLLKYNKKNVENISEKVWGKEDNELHKLRADNKRL